jgi:hypothetical protein
MASIGIKLFRKHLVTDNPDRCRGQKAPIYTVMAEAVDPGSESMVTKKSE